jgi:hypothetical protein
MAAASLRILEAPSAGARMGEAARQLAVERFDITHSLRALERIYVEAAAARPRRGATRARR